MEQGWIIMLTCHDQAVHDGAHVRVSGVKLPCPRTSLAELHSELLQVLGSHKLGLHLLD